LIARQRSILNRTFVQEQDAPASDEAIHRLSKAQMELSATTDRFANGMAQRGEQIPALREAVAAMNRSSSALTEKKLAAARPHEETALAALVRARRNMRKLLSQNNQQQASACRSFDRKEEQVLRRRPQGEKKRQMASLEKDLRALAQEERAVAQEMEPRSRSGPPKSGQPSSSPGDPVERQRQAVREAERLRDLACQDEALTDRTRGRFADVTETIRKSTDEIRASRRAEAAQRARAVAEQLERLARQVGAQQASELADQIARTRDLTRELAALERALAQALRAGPVDANDGTSGRWASRERELAEEAAGVADVLDRLRDETALRDAQLARTLGEAVRSQQAREIEQAMKQSAQAAETGQGSAAEKDAQAASARLDELAAKLESTRRELVQPQLDRFLAAEKQAARVQDQLNSVKSAAQQTQAERALSDLARNLDSLNPAEGSLREAALRLSGAIGAGATRDWRREEVQTPGSSGLFIPPTNYSESVRAVILALQGRIQQLVVDRALMERDEAVPPRYKTLVEDYYRVLSQDLR
jgi:hypothetical protein